jgi:hypothetical protein
MVVGATHPHVKRDDGESYRLSLQRLAQQVQVDAHVMFYNRFVTTEELLDFIGAADIYITPYQNETQITSGTLAYALGAGKAVISTPYWYAEELLADDRGILVPFCDPTALAERVNALLEDESTRHAMRKRGYLLGRDMIWPQVARRYMEAFQRARAERRYFAAPRFRLKAMNQDVLELPPLKLDHLRRMTDDTGILQHAFYTVPNYSEGYTTDDNARALIVSILLEESGSGEAIDHAYRYLAFLAYAFNARTQRFRNFMDYRRGWLEEVGSDDSHGRALWALGMLLGRFSSPSFQTTAGHIFERALPAVLGMSNPRAWAFALLGVHEYLKRFDGDRRVGQVREELASRLISGYKRHRTNGWFWFENSLTYCNAVLPHALLLCGQWTSNRCIVETGLQSLNWLCELQHAASPGGHFVPIGSNGFYRRGGERARFDQQPVEAQSTLSACLEAHRATGDKRWHEEARCAFDWFLGRNDLNLPIYDPITGGCRDGLHADRTNENQGAESTLSFLQALLELHSAEATLEVRA